MKQIRSISIHKLLYTIAAVSILFPLTKSQALANTVTGTASATSIGLNQTTTITLNATTSQPISGYEVRVGFSPNAVEVVANSTQKGTILTAADGFMINNPLVNNNTGRITFVAISTDGSTKSGTGTLGSFQLKGVSAGNAMLTLELVQLTNENLDPISQINQSVPTITVTSGPTGDPQPTPTITPIPTPMVATPTTTPNHVSVSLSNPSINIGQTTIVTINGSATPAIAGYEVRFSFNPDVVELVTGSAQKGTFLPASEGFMVNNPQVSPANDRVTFVAVSADGSSKAGYGTIGTLQLRGKAVGNANIAFDLAQYVNAQLQPQLPSSSQPNLIVSTNDHNPTPTAIPTNTPTPTEIPGSASVAIKFRLQGVTASPPSGTALIPTEVTVRLFRGSESAPLATRKATPQIDSQGIHTVIIDDFPAGNDYRLCIKGQSHLQKCFRDINLVNNETLLLKKADEYSDQLWAGDLNNDNVVDAADIAIVTSARQPAIFSNDSYKVPLSLLKQKMEQLNIGGAIIISPHAMNADIDKNGFVTEADKALAQIKYTTLRFLGDQ